MPNKDNNAGNIDVSELRMPERQVDRRKKHRNKDTLYRIVVALNIVAWTMLVSALLVFHYARPDFIAGVQNYWGIDGRDFWSQAHLDNLLLLLQACLIISLSAIVLRTRRSRRKSDSFGYNLLVLFVISIVSLATIYTTV
ncbi:hypothetical protein [Agaribacter marinus]|uniref:Uncharacterized protein n=1 Tax=Agaribacter marinus TaxID=1431249 RepID=A0AA37T217_9ALTE|nr:hypothetical protein [Agaribacter marinus]GLR72131.1 hypothetical protein GCM10007852_30390 [Agaribacter marinus]